MAVLLVGTLHKLLCPLLKPLRQVVPHAIRGSKCVVIVLVYKPGNISLREGGCDPFTVAFYFLTYDLFKTLHKNCIFFLSEDTQLQLGVLSTKKLVFDRRFFMENNGYSN